MIFRYMLPPKKYKRLSTPWILNRVPAFSRVLDIGGVGRGPLQDLTRELLQKGNLVTEVDIERSGFKHPNLTLVEKNILATNFEPKSFDLILSIHVLQHIGNKWQGKNDIFDAEGDVKVAEKILRWVKPGGHVFIETTIASRMSTLIWDKDTEWTIYTLDYLHKLFRRFIFVDSFVYDGALDSRKRISDAQAVVLMLRKPSGKKRTVAGCLTLYDEERKLITPGHMLHMVQWNNEFIAYLGMVSFEGIYLWRGPDIYSLKPCLEGPVIPNMRTATVVVIKKTIHLFCAGKIGAEKKDIFRYQDIWHFESRDGKNFKKIGRITSGSAPFIFSHQNRFYLYFHRRTDKQHQILLRSSSTVTGLATAKETQLVRRTSSFSVPSMCCYGNIFLLTCEELIGDEWVTVLFKGVSPTGPFIEAAEHLMPVPCVYQHLFGNRCFLTYSKKSMEGQWELWIREGEISDFSLSAKDKGNESK
jgi:2-polyprenyl-3-methyl-5-hydroxy-6-metoxy-1,4-benzoquinol methylase